MRRGHAGGRRGTLARAARLLAAPVLAAIVLTAPAPGWAAVQGPQVPRTVASERSVSGGPASESVAQATSGGPASVSVARATANGLASVFVAQAASGGPASEFVAQAASGGPASAAVAPLTPAEQRRADELRDVARDALERDGDGDGLGDLDTGSLGGVLWRLALVVVLVVAAIVAVALLRRGPRARRRVAAASGGPADGAIDLEREALRAEEAGEHRAAVVLWFRAGTRGLLQRRRIRPAGVATAGQVARAAEDDRVAALAVAHDRAAYGPGPVGPDASRDAREGWATVLREAPAPPGDPREGRS